MEDREKPYMGKYELLELWCQLYAYITSSAWFLLQLHSVPIVYMGVEPDLSC
jgi:hypothetical protein